MTDAMRAMDAAVAERVMGWVRHHANTAYWYERGYTIASKPVGVHPECSTGHWSPSRDVSAAWSVVERMRALGWRVWIFVTETKCTVAVRDSENIVQADTFPLAVCRAALLALPPAGGQEPANG